MSKKKKTGFQYKLFRIVTESPPDIIGWNADGISFSIRHRERLSSEILGEYFRHANFDSFLRQLGFYSFQRLENHQSEGTTFQNPNFRKGRPDLLSNLKRRTYADEGIRNDVKKLQNDVTELRSNLHDLRSAMIQMQQQMTQMSSALSSLGVAQPVPPSALSINSSQSPTSVPEGTAVAMSPSEWNSPHITASSFDFGSSTFGSANFGSIDVAASTAMIPDDEGAEHLLGTPSFSTGSRFGAGGTRTVSMSEEPAHKMVRRQEPVDVQPAVQWQNSFGSQKADDGWSFQSLS